VRAPSNQAQQHYTSTADAIALVTVCFVRQVLLEPLFLFSCDFVSFGGSSELYSRHGAAVGATTATTASAATTATNATNATARRDCERRPNLIGRESERCPRSTQKRLYVLQEKRRQVCNVFQSSWKNKV
jgi:hypothetical protein